MAIPVKTNLDFASGPATVKGLPDAIADGDAVPLSQLIGIDALTNFYNITELDSLYYKKTVVDAALASAVAAAVAIASPIGKVINFAGTSIPSGWLECYGQAISRTTYSALFAVIGTTYGSGDGTTTFNLPDARGRVIAGEDDMGGSSANRLTNQSGGLDGDVLGATGGAETHTLSSGEIPSNASSHPGTTGGTGNPGLGHTGSASNAHNNVQPTIILKTLIYAGA